MALSHQATTTNTSTADRSSASFAHDAGSGSNRVMLVTTKTLTASGSISVSSITYNGVALTFIQGHSREYTTNRYLRIENWYLIAPATGSNTLAVTYSGNARADEITVTTLNGGHQTTPVGVVNAADGDSTNPSVTLTTGTNNSWVMFGAHGRGGDLDPFTPGTGLTELTDGDTGASTSDDIAFTDGYETTTTAGSVTVDSTFTGGSDQWVAAAVEIKEASGAITATVNQATETDTAQAITALKALAAGQNSETDTAQPVARLKTLAVAQASESDTAQAITARKTLAIGQAEEADTAQAVTVSTPTTIGQVSETDTAQPVTARKTLAVGQANETDVAQPITRVKLLVIGIVTETDSSQVITARKLKAIGQASETDTALVITAVSGSVVVGAVVVLSDAALWLVVLGNSALYSVVLGDSALYGITLQNNER